ncbi:MAG TPA: chemotaxis protein CheB [Gemmatimonadaceae bacterium]|nr:chemotaxis protein CheB [Gemmatimonadaceae bacterium]
MTRCNVIVIGASAGGVNSLMRLVSLLPANLSAAIAVAVHVPERARSVLPSILSRHGPVPATHATDGEPLAHGHIYVAPPGYHLLVKRGRLRVVNGPHENGHRPSVDPLFRSAARAHGRRAIGVILSGSLDDGTAGLLSIKDAGGTALVQDPSEAMFDGMPVSAIENVSVDFVGTVDALADELRARVAALTAMPGDTDMENENGDELDVVEMDSGTPDPDHWNALPSEFTCPHCHGSLFERHDGHFVRYRCRTGHAYSPDTLAAAQSDGIEAALWIALRSLEESAALHRRLHERAAGRGQALTAGQFLSRAIGFESRARIIRDVLVDGEVADGEVAAD